MVLLRESLATRTQTRSLRFRAGLAVFTAAVAVGEPTPAGSHGAMPSASRPADGSDTTAASSRPAEPGGEATVESERFMSDEEFLRIGLEFDLDGFIKSLNPPSVEQIIESLEPIPTREQVLDEVRHPERLSRPPLLPDSVAAEVARIEQRIAALKRQNALSDDEQSQNAALDEAIRLAEQLVKLRTEVRHPPDWYEVVDARDRVSILKTVRALSPEKRRLLDAAEVRRPKFDRLYANRDFVRAIAVARAQLAIWQQLYTSDHPTLAMGLGNIASLLVDLGTMDNAERLSRYALTMTRRIYPGDHPATVSSLGVLAYIMGSRGALEEAESLQRKSLTMNRRLRPGETPEAVGSLHNLVYILQARGALAEAEPLSRDALAMTQRLFPGDNPHVAASLSVLATILQARGKLTESEPFYRDALSMVQRLFPGDHPHVAASIGNLAGILQDRGALTEAEPLYREALAMNQRLFAGDHPAVATCLNNLGDILQARGDLTEAERVLRESLAMTERLFPGDNHILAGSMASLAHTLGARGKLKEAELLLRDALNMTQRMFPGDHPQVASELNNLANILQARGALAEAEPLCRQAIAMTERVLGKEGLHVALVLDNLASILRARQDVGEVESLCRLTFEMSERLRTQIIGGEQERAAFAQTLRLSARATAYAEVLVRLDRGGEAFGVLERGRARAALDLLERAGRDLIVEAHRLGDEKRTKRLEEAQAAEHSARIDLISTEALLAGRRRERDTLAKRGDVSDDKKKQQAANYDKEIGALVEQVRQKQIVLGQAGQAVLSELRGLFPAGKALAAEDILRGLASDEAVVSFAWSGESVLVAVAAGGESSAEIVAKDKDAVKQLEEQAERVRGALAQRPTGDFDVSNARALLAALLPESIRARIAGARRLIVLPDGPLTDLPFEVLADVDVDSPLARQEIVYAPSATIYLDRKARRTAHPLRKPEEDALAAVILCDPDFGEGQRREPDYPKQGVLLAVVQDGSNAAKAGLRRGDVLLRYDGKPLTAAAELGPAIQKAAAAAVTRSAERSDEEPVDGPSIKIAYWRDGTTQETRVHPGRLGVGPAQASPDEILRSWTRLDQITRGGGAEFAATASALEGLRLFGGQLARLRGTDREGRAVAELLRKAGGRAVVLSGPDARVLRLSDAVTANRPRFLHLATHGLMGSADRPMDACLALSQPAEPTPQDIGFLRLEDLASKWGGRLNDCELVVLSACDTQRGVRRGDSVMSLPLGFFFAGAPTVVASLWKVDDTATMLLMTRFYENLLGAFPESRRVGGRNYAPGTLMPKSIALTEAKRWLRALPPREAEALVRQKERETDGGSSESVVLVPSREQPRGGLGQKPIGGGETRVPYDYSHPYYWAAFVLIGDPE